MVSRSVVLLIRLDETFFKQKKSVKLLMVKCTLGNKKILRSEQKSGGSKLTGYTPASKNVRGKRIA